MRQNYVQSDMGINISAYWILILISTWTIIQSIFHMLWIIYAYYTSTCKIRPISYYDVIFVYLTYFYRQECGQIDLQNEGLFFNTTPPLTHPYEISDSSSDNKTASEILYEFLKATLKNASLPQESDGATRLDIYLTIFFVSDGIWILTAVLLFSAAIRKLGKQWFFPCYGPWLFMTAFLIFLDVVSSVHFGLDLINVYSFSTWLKFIGVSNYKEFEYFNTYADSRVLSALPSTVMVTLFSRCFIVWLINVMCFFAVLFRMLEMLYKPKNKPMRSSLIKRKPRKLDNLSGLSNDFNLNTTEARIRNWQLFYGAIEANSTRTSTSNSLASDTDLNCNEKNQENNDLKFADGRYFNFDKEEKESAHSYDSLEINKNGYRRFSDVALDMPNLVTFQDTQENIENCNNVNNYQIEVQVLRNQMPWSYTNPGGIYLKKHTLKNGGGHPSNCDVIFEKAVESTEL